MISERAKRIGLKELEIFDNFKFDKKLPKYNSSELSEITNDAITINSSETFVVSNSTFINESWGNNVGVDFETPLKTNWFISLIKKIIIFFKKKKHYDNIYDFFMDFQGKVKNIIIVEEIYQYYIEALKQAQESGQVTLQEKLKDLIDIFKFESLLFAMKLTKFVTEEQIYDFYVKKAGGDKALKLTWIKNFIRIIPSDVLKLKKIVDEQKIFDNYVILHYDKGDDGSELTKKEKEIKKDPILFGVIAKSKKLYYIADWKDEVCDLTLDKMFSELGENILKINNKSVKSYIDIGSDNRKRSFKRKKS